MKTRLTIAAFALLAVTAVLGWTRKPTLAANNFVPNSPWSQQYGQPYNAYTTQPGMQPVAFGQYPQGAYPMGYGAAVNCVDPNAPAMHYQNAMYVPGQGYGAYAPARYETVRTVRTQPRVYRSSYVPRERYVARRGRSTGKSVAIVAGSAGAGAAIGALAGGGKGAAIGALTGGAAGFIYDRLTHNR
jgi:hypothetical protein